MEEAILQGFLELVERDAVAIWWYNRLRRPGVDLDSFENPYFQQTKRFYDERDLQLHVLDITSDLGVPAVIAASALPDGSDVFVGMAAHLDIELAISRALTEVVQQGVPGQQGPEEAVADSLSFKRRRLKRENLNQHPHMFPAGPVKVRRDYPRHSTTDLLDDIDHATTLLEQAGLEMLLLDLTRREAGFPVVRVTVPGLRHYWARYGPGRLYDVPVKMGWLPSPTPESDLNPTPWLG